VSLPFALAKKYPNAEFEWKWQYIFPSVKLSIDPRSGIKRRHHLHQSLLPRKISQASRKAGIHKKVTTHISPLICNTSLGDGYDIRTVQELLGHSPREIDHHKIKSEIFVPVALNRSPGRNRTFISRGKDVRTTMIYTHVLNRSGLGVKSPLDD